MTNTMPTTTDETTQFWLRAKAQVIIDSHLIKSLVIAYVSIGDMVVCHTF